MYRIQTSGTGLSFCCGSTAMFPDEYITTEKDLGKTLYRLLKEEPYKHERFGLSVKRI